jgi:RHS repeat-associated protein
MIHQAAHNQPPNTAALWRDVQRYGFQGQEEDQEMWEGSVSYKYRVEDARLGRFFSVDPLMAKFPWNSAYAFAENKGVSTIELEGLEGVNVVDHTTETTSLEIDYYYIESQPDQGTIGTDARAFTSLQIDEIKSAISDEINRGEKLVDYRYKKNDGSPYDVKINISFIPCPDHESVKTCINDPDVIERGAMLMYVPARVSEDGGSFVPGGAANALLNISNPNDGHTIVHEIFHNFVHHGKAMDPNVAFFGFDWRNQGPWHERWGGIFSYKDPAKVVLTQSNVFDAINATPTYFNAPYPPSIPWKALGL